MNIIYVYHYGITSREKKWQTVRSVGISTTPDRRPIGMCVSRQNPPKLEKKTRESLFLWYSRGRFRLPQTTGLRDV